MTLEEAKEMLDKLTEANGRLADLGQPTVAVPASDAKPGLKLREAKDIATINALLDDYNAYCDKLKEAAIEAEKQLKKAQVAAAAGAADALLAEQLTGGNVVVCAEGGNELLTELFNGLKKRHYDAAAFLVCDDGASLSLGAYCGEAAQAAGLKAGDLIRVLAPIVGGKGGGKADMARGSGKDRSAKDALLAEAAKTLS